MKRILIYLMLILILPALAQAQVSKQVNVEKDYTPHVESAQKLAMVPDMTDTVMMRPEVDYAFTPRGYDREFQACNHHILGFCTFPHALCQGCGRCPLCE